MYRGGGKDLMYKLNLKIAVYDSSLKNPGATCNEVFVSKLLCRIILFHMKIAPQREGVACTSTPTDRGSFAAYGGGVKIVTHMNREDI